MRTATPWPSPSRFYPGNAGPVTDPRWSLRPIGNRVSRLIHRLAALAARANRPSAPTPSHNCGGWMRCVCRDVVRGLVILYLAGSPVWWYDGNGVSAEHPHATPINKPAGTPLC